jgi:hypothetical protein
MAMVVRGVFLSAAAAMAAAGAVRSARSLKGALVAPPLALAALLLAWAGVIHLGGGEKFDDHPWV